MQELPTGDEVGAAAVVFVKANKREIIERYSSLAEYPAAESPESLFMAGSPGAGKTEFSKQFCQFTREKDPAYRVVRLDADEIRHGLPGYTGRNSSAVQEAAVLAVNKVFDSVLSRRQHVLLDGTFARYDLARKNVDRSLAKGRRVGIFYLYQDPVVAWEFTKKREVLEGRLVPKDVFIRAFFDAKVNVQRIKEEFGERIVVYLVMMGTDSVVEKFYIDVDTIDSYLKVGYDPSTLTEALHD